MVRSEKEDMLDKQQTKRNGGRQTDRQQVAGAVHACPPPPIDRGGKRGSLSLALSWMDECKQGVDRLWTRRDEQRCPTQPSDIDRTNVSPRIVGRCYDAPPSSLHTHVFIWDPLSRLHLFKINKYWLSFEFMIVGQKSMTRLIIVLRWLVAVAFDFLADRQFLRLILVDIHRIIMPLYLSLSLSVMIGYYYTESHKSWPESISTLR
jgi:hypothetical protein